MFVARQEATARCETAECSPHLYRATGSLENVTCGEVHDVDPSDAVFGAPGYGTRTSSKNAQDRPAVTDFSTRPPPATRSAVATSAVESTATVKAARVESASGCVASECPIEGPQALLA